MTGDSNKHLFKQVVKQVFIPESLTPRQLIPGISLILVGCFSNSLSMPADANLKVMFVSRVPEQLKARIGWGSSLWWNFVSFGLPAWLLFNYYFISRFTQMQGDLLFRITLYLAGCCVWVGPLLNHWWEKMFENFYRRVKEKAAAEAWSMDSMESVRTRFDAIRFWFPPVFILTTLAASLISFQALSPYFGITGWHDPFQWILLIMAAVLGYTGGIGLWGVLKSIAIVMRISATSIPWHPFHEDGLGGLQFIGDFSLMTTLLFSVGTLAVPLSVEIMELLHGVARLAVGASPFLFSVGIAASFLVPTVVISRVAGQKKEELLQRIRVHIDRGMNSLFMATAGTTPEGPDSRLKAHELITAEVGLYDRIQNTAIYPFGAMAVVKLALSVIAPVLLFLLELFGQSYLGL